MTIGTAECEVINEKADCKEKNFYFQRPDDTGVTGYCV